MPVESFFITELREQSTNLQDQIEQLRRSIETQNVQLRALSSRIHDDNVQLRALNSRLRDVNSQIRNNTSRRVNNSNNTNGLQMPNNSSPPRLRGGHRIRRSVERRQNRRVRGLTPPPLTRQTNRPLDNTEGNDNTARRLNFGTDGEADVDADGLKVRSRLIF